MKKLLPLGLLIALVAFSVFVWPTKWRYDTIAMADKTVLVRTDRFSDKSFYLTPHGWVSAKPRPY